jgi:hypothetical protein
MWMLPCGRIVTLPGGPGNTVPRTVRYDVTRKPARREDVNAARGNLTQRGLSALGALIVVVLAVVALYYVYIGVTGQDERQTCSTEFEHCMQVCRRTSTDNDSAQACQRKCMSDADFCRTAEQRNK